MNVFESVRIAFRALNANKARSALTMLGVIIGVAAVILLVAIGSGVQDDITSQIEGIGSNLLFVFPADFEGGSGPGGGFGGQAFSNEDAALIERRVEGLDAVVPVVEGQVTAERGNRSIRTLIQAGTEKGEEVFAADLAGGRHYNASEVQAGARVVGLGATVAEELFPGQDTKAREASSGTTRWCGPDRSPGRPSAPTPVALARE